LTIEERVSVGVVSVAGVGDLESDDAASDAVSEPTQPAELAPGASEVSDGGGFGVIVILGGEGDTKRPLDFGHDARVAL